MAWNPQPGCRAFSLRENNVSGATLAQRCDKRQQWIAATSNDREVRLHLFAKLGFEAHNGFVGFGFQCQQKAGEDGAIARVALLSDLPE